MGNGMSPSKREESDLRGRGQTLGSRRAGDVERGSSRVEKLLDAVDAALSRVDERLDRAAGDVVARWHRYVLASVVGALVVGALMHGLLGLAGPAGVVGGLVVIAIVAAASGLLVLMARNYLVSKAEPQDRRPFMVAMLVSAGALAAWVEASAGLASLGSRYGFVYAETLPLWRSEQLILWQLVESVPLLAIPDRLGWDEPLQLTGVAGGILVLAFKVVVIATLLRMAVAIYQLTEQHRRAERNLAMHVQSRLRRSRLITYSATPSFWPELLVAIVGMGLVYATVGADSPVRQWLTKHAPSLELFGITIASSKISFLPQLLALGVIGRMLLQMPAKIRAADQFTQPSVAKGTLGAYAAIVVQVATTAAATVLVLHDAGLADLHPGDAAEGTTSTLALLAVGWHLLNALPGQDVPETVGWTITQDFVGVWAGVVVVVQLIVTVALVIFPMARVVARWANLSSRWTRPDPPLSVVPASLARDLDTVMTILDRHDHNPRLESIRHLADSFPPHRLRPPHVDSKSLALLTDLLEAERRLTEAERSRRKIWELFADGPVYLAADRAIFSVHQRYEASTQTRVPPLRALPRWAPKPLSPQASRREATSAVASYKRLIGLQ